MRYPAAAQCRIFSTCVVARGSFIPSHLLVITPFVKPFRGGDDVQPSGVVPFLVAEHLPAWQNPFSYIMPLKKEGRRKTQHVHADEKRCLLPSLCLSLSNLPASLIPWAASLMWHGHLCLLCQLYVFYHSPPCLQPSLLLSPLSLHREQAL